MMPRNLEKRVELMVPIRDGRIRSELSDILDRSIADDMNSWELNSDGDWLRREATEGRSVQREMTEIHNARSAETAH